jgi:hypothetical protein
MEKLDVMGDAKSAYLIKLANITNEIAFNLSAGMDGSAMRLLGALMAMIEIDDGETELKELQRKFVEDYQTFTPSINLKDTHLYFFQVCHYLNQTYFREFKYASPKYPSDKIEVPKE